MKLYRQNTLKYGEKLLNKPLVQFKERENNNL